MTGGTSLGSGRRLGRTEAPAFPLEGKGVWAEPLPLLPPSWALGSLEGTGLQTVFPPGHCKDRSHVSANPLPPRSHGEQVTVQVGDYE